MRELERRVLLTVLDRKWREHLYEMDYLREGIGLRAMAQRDPLVEYQREGGDMFNAMMEAFMEEVVGFVFHLEVEVEPTPAAGVGVVTGGAGQPLSGADSNGPRARAVGGRTARRTGTGAPDRDRPRPGRPRRRGPPSRRGDGRSRRARAPSETALTAAGPGQGPFGPRPARGGLLGPGRGRDRRPPARRRRQDDPYAASAATRPAPAARARSSRCATGAPAPDRHPG